MQITDIGYGRGWLDAPAAASLARVDREIGHPLQITDAGRTREQQQQNYDAWKNGTGSFAAYPGTSPHEFGNAIDTNERLTSILARHGWWRPLGNEPWHYVYRTWADEHINDPTPTGGGASASILSEEDDMATLISSPGGKSLVVGGRLFGFNGPDEANAVSGAQFLNVPTALHARINDEFGRSNPNGALPTIVYVRDGDNTVYLWDQGKLKPLVDQATLAELHGKNAPSFTLSQAEVTNLLAS